MAQSKRVGILTSGGDCPGLNAVIRAVVSHATLTHGWEVWGIPYATKGLLERQSIPLGVHSLDLRGIDPLLNMGGTILGTINHGDTLAHADEILESYQAMGLDALIAIGGDGSLAILHELAKRGNWQMVAIPKTIDNDVALNRLTFTAASHDRVMVVEVMGRKVGHLALHAGIAGGADVILLPEIPYSVQGICHHIKELRDRWGRKFAIVVVAEGAHRTSEPLIDEVAQGLKCGTGQYIADQIAQCSHHDLEVRVSVLGHIQRGGIPSAIDRLTAAAFGKTAVDLLAQGETGKMVAWRGGQVEAVQIQDVVAHSPLPVDPDGALVQTARALAIYVGDLSCAS